MREWSKKHIEELIKNTGGGGGSVGEGAQTFHIMLSSNKFRHPFEVSEDPAGQVLDCTVITKDGGSQQRLRFYRLGGETTPAILVRDVYAAATPTYDYYKKKWVAEIATCVPIQIGLYTKDTTKPQAYAAGVLWVAGTIESDSLIHSRSWETTYQAPMNMCVGAGALSEFGDWTIIQPTGNLIGYLGNFGASMV